jgi:rhodanese-related sulfurtransferase
MTALLHPLTPQQVRERLDAGRAILVDIREADEFARSHITGAQSQPLSTWEKAHLSVDPDADVIFTCRSGMRTACACDRLAARVIALPRG